MKVVNNFTEHRIVLIKKFNFRLTKNKKQYLLRLVYLHRGQYPVASKRDDDELG